jgi:L-rhamnose-H+ transport protein
MELINGIFYHAVGASGAALCYTPQKKVMGWSWQTYWMAQAFICWLVLPVAIAWITIPELTAVLREAPADAMQRSFFLGMAYGIGGTAFGIAIRYVGFSLTYAISVGISCVLGTLLPPMVKGTLTGILDSHGSSFIISGVIMGAIGILLCGLAGRDKEKDMAKRSGAAAEIGGTDAFGHVRFSLSKGLPLCLLAGFLSALYGFSLDQGQPIAEVAARHGAGQLQGNVVYLFSNTGAFVTTAVYCLYLHGKDRTFFEYKKEDGHLVTNYLMAFLTGLLWYGQFFFYGLGHVRMGNFKFTSWAIHMIMLVMLSSIAGLLMKEWKGSSKKTVRALAAALVVLLIAILFLTYGNHLGGKE